MTRTYQQPPRHYNPLPMFGLRTRELAYHETPLGFLDIITARRGSFDITDPNSPIVWDDEWQAGPAGVGELWISPAAREWLDEHDHE